MPTLNRCAATDTKYLILIQKSIFDTRRTKSPSLYCHLYSLPSIVFGLFDFQYVRFNINNPIFSHQIIVYRSTIDWNRRQTLQPNFPSCVLFVQFYCFHYISFALVHQNLRAHLYASQCSHAFIHSSRSCRTSKSSHKYG